MPARASDGNVTRLRGKGVARKGKEPETSTSSSSSTYPSRTIPEVAAQAVDTLAATMTQAALGRISK